MEAVPEPVKEEIQEPCQTVPIQEPVKGKYVKQKITKSISEGRKKSAITRTNNNETYKKKANLFDKYLAGDLTRDELLLAGFIPSEKTPPKTILEQPKTIEPEKPRAKTTTSDILNFLID